MPPARGAKRRTRFSQSPEFRQDEGSSRDHKVTDHVRTAEEMLKASRKRREVKRRAIEKSYREQVENVHVKIEAFYENRKKKIIKVQLAQWDQLSALLEERGAIEAVIFEHLKRLEDSTLNLSMELNTIYEGRLEEILELNTTGKLAVIIVPTGLRTRHNVDTDLK